MMRLARDVAAGLCLGLILSVPTTLVLSQFAPAAEAAEAAAAAAAAPSSIEEWRTMPLEDLR